jgi:phosphatidylglycerophosphatase C
MGGDDSLRQRANEAAPGHSTPPATVWGKGADIARAVARRPVAAFDFDGTITVKDSFMAFLRWRSGPVRFAVGMLRLLPATLAYLGHRDRGRLKAAAVQVFLKGLTEAELLRSTGEFAAWAWPRLIRPDAEKTWRAWRDKGAAVIIVTASPEEVVAPFAERLGADALIGTRLAYDAQGRLTGAFASENCRGPQKVARLEAELGPGLRLAAAYGDTSGDTEMLAIADEPGFRVFTEEPARP